MSIDPNTAKGSELRKWLTERKINFKKSETVELLRAYVRRELSDEAFRQKCRLSDAFRMTEPVERDVRPPLSGNYGTLATRRDADFTEGWDFNGHTLEVHQAWSTSTSHGSGRFRVDRHGTQGPRALFSTEKKALRALRSDLEQETAKKLVAIDKQIAKASGDDDGESSS